MVFSFGWMLVLTELNRQELFIHYFGSFMLAAVYTIIAGALYDMLGCQEIGLMIIFVTYFTATVFFEVQSNKMSADLNLVELNISSDLSSNASSLNTSTVAKLSANTFICKSWRYQFPAVILHISEQQSFASICLGYV